MRWTRDPCVESLFSGGDLVDMQHNYCLHFHFFTKKIALLRYKSFTAQFVHLKYTSQALFLSLVSVFSILVYTISVYIYLVCKYIIYMFM